MIGLLLPILLFAGSDFTPRPPSVITNPNWVNKPNGNDLANYYPPKALEGGVSGHSAMECTVMADGTLANCFIVSETPADMGFGVAELRLAPRFRMQPQTTDGQPVDGAKVMIPVAWSVAADEPPPPDPQPRLVTPPIIVSRGGGALTANPEWEKTPSDVDIDLSHPITERGRAGTVAMVCDLGGGGFITGCVVESATSDAFASAALNLSSHYKVKIASLADQAFIGTRVRIWTNWPATIAPMIPAPAVAPPVVHPNLPIPNQRPVIVAPSGPPPPMPKASAVVLDPQWVKLPNDADVRSYYPPKAFETGIAGHTSMECVVNDNGTLNSCHLLSETPSAMGFGAAELALAGKFRMRPQTVDGQPVGGAKVVIPFSWSLAAAVPSPAPAPH